MSEQSPQSTQDLIDYLNSLNALYTTQITEQQNTKVNLDAAINDQLANIQNFEAQKVQCDQNIATCQQNIIYNDELIVIVQGV